MALGDLTKARGMSAISKKTGLNRENIYRIVSTKGNPQIKSILALLDAIGLTLKTEPTAKTRKKVWQIETPANVISFEEHAKLRKERQAQVVAAAAHREAGTQTFTRQEATQYVAQAS